MLYCQLIYVQPTTQQYKSTFVQKHLYYNKVAIMKNANNVIKIDAFGYKDTGKSMKNTLYILQYAKRHLLDQNSEKESSL